MYNNLMFVAGITGNYGMGKSTVLSIFRKLGAITIDADRIVQRLLREKDMLNKIKALLGAGVFDSKGALDNKKVAEKIFKDKKLRLGLEDILHPQVFESIDSFIQHTKNKNKVFIVEAPLIFERGYEDRFDRIITVFTDKQTAIKRLGVAGIDTKIAGQRLRCQIPITDKIRMADFTIDNSGNLEKTQRQIKELFKKLSEEARIKKLILHGKVHEAKKLLKKPYYIEGTVIKGAGRGGRLLHTPTANLSVKKRTDIKDGVYAVKVSIEKKNTEHRTQNTEIKNLGSGLRTQGSVLHDGVANIGKNPTFGIQPLSYEVHLFNFSGNILGKKLRVNFIDRIRNEKKFQNVKALENQIKKDIKKAKEILKTI